MEKLHIENWDYNNQSVEEATTSLLPFFDKASCLTGEERLSGAKAFYDVLHSLHKNLKTSSLSVAAGTLFYCQYDEKEYYHDGSQQYRVCTEIDEISEEQYHAASVPEQDKIFFETQKILSGLCTVCSECKPVAEKGLTSTATLIYAKDFLGCFKYMRIYIYSWV